MRKRSDAVERILDRLHQTAQKHGAVSVGDIVEALGDRGWGPLLFVPALIELSPAHRRRPRRVSSAKRRAAADKMRPFGRWLDRWFHGRLPRFTTDRVTRIAVVLVLCLTVLPLELLPLASSVPMATIAIFGLAFTMCDGLLMVLGFVLSGLAVADGAGLWGGR